MNMGWIGVDLDGTLAEYHGWKDVNHIGPPVPAMLERVKAWLAAGEDVRIFTARVSNPEQEVQSRRAIQFWCTEHIGKELPITCRKDFQMRELYDDRCVTVEQNTGRLLSAEQPRFTP